jgi:hypothetical protein
MKFIGQFIQDFIARFRNDVYLEDIDTGTIVSGGNLGLDSNNKIVKNTVGGGGTTDLTSDVTGILPVANGGTGQSSLGSVNISDLNNDSGFTTNTGDITGITVSDGATSHTTSSGTHTTQFLTGEGIDVAINSLSGTVKQVTYSAEDASTSNKGIVELATTAEADTGTDTSRAVTPAGLKSHVDARYTYQYISFVGNITANTSGNGYWEYPSPNGISNHTWTQIVQTKVDGTDNRDTTTVGDEVGIDRLNQGSAGIRIPYAGTIVGFTGSGRNASGNRAYYGGLFVGTPDWGTTNKIDAELVAVAQADASPGGNLQSKPAKVEDLSRSYSISAGDVIYPAIKGSGTNADVIQVSWTIVIKTSIV